MKKRLIFEKQIVPVSWHCDKLNIDIKVSKEAICGLDGWLCGCGEWVDEDSNTHSRFTMGERKALSRIIEEK